MLTPLLHQSMSVLRPLAIAICLTSLAATVGRADVVVPAVERAAPTGPKPIAQSTCQKAQSNQVALDFNQVYNREKWVGEVQSVTNAADGSTIVLKQNNQEMRRIFLPNSIGGNFENLIGKRIVLTQVICSSPLTSVPENPSEVPPPKVLIPQQW
jgi:hypothetical protein